jgi:hypothetical protein
MIETKLELGNTVSKIRGLFPDCFDKEGKIIYHKLCDELGEPENTETVKQRGERQQAEVKIIKNLKKSIDFSKYGGHAEIQMDINYDYWSEEMTITTDEPLVDDDIKKIEKALDMGNIDSEHKYLFLFRED